MTGILTFDLCQCYILSLKKYLKCVFDSSWLCVRTVHVILYCFPVGHSFVQFARPLLCKLACVCMRMLPMLGSSFASNIQSHISSCHHSLPFILQLLFFFPFFGANVIKPLITSCGTKLIEDDWFFPGCSDPALANRQRELEEELAQARALRPQKGKKMGSSSPRNLQVQAVFHYIWCHLKNVYKYTRLKLVFNI